MLLLLSTDSLQVVTGSAGSVDIHASWSNLNTSTGAVTPDRTLVNTAAATTSTACASPSSGNVRTVKTLTVRNKHASNANDITVQHFNGSTAFELIKVTLSAGEQLHY